MAQAQQQQQQQQELVPTQGTRQVTKDAGKGIYKDLPSLIEGFRHLHGKYNVCMPITQPDLIPPMYAVALRPVAIDTRVDDKGRPLGPDIYQDGRDRTKYGLTKIGLHKFAAAANLSWHPAYTGRVDDGTELWFRRYRACGVVLGLDGTPRYLTAHKSIDLRVTKWGEKKVETKQGTKTVRVVAEGGKDAVGMSESQLNEARKFIDEICESKAMNRVLRQYAFIKGLYSREELNRPFVICALVFTGETEDPELRREVAKAMVERAMGATTALFGPAPSAPHLIEDLGQRTPPPAIGMSLDDDDDDRESAVDATLGEPEEHEDSQDESESDGIQRFIAKVTKVSSESGITNGKRWTLHTIELEDVKVTTFSKTSAGIASDAYEKDQLVAVEARKTDYGLQLESIRIVEE